MAKVAGQAADAGLPPAARLLYTEAELRDLRRLQAIARTERAGDAR
jgi:hypothetical protein